MRRMRRPTLRLAFAATAVVLLAATTIHTQDNRTAQLLAELIRIDTSNPPGREGLIAEFLTPRFRELGFQVDVVPTPEAGKAHFFARLKGDGSKAADPPCRTCRRRRRRAREMDG